MYRFTGKGTTHFQTAGGWERVAAGSVVSEADYLRLIAANPQELAKLFSKIEPKKTKNEVPRTNEGAAEPTE